MGESTTTCTTISKADLNAVKEILLETDWQEHGWCFDDEYDNGDGTVTIRQLDVSYDGVFDADALESAGIPFVIDHDGWFRCLPGCIAFDGVSREGIDMFEDRPLLAFDLETESADEDELAHVRAFMALYRRAVVAMKNRAGFCSVDE